MKDLKFLHENLYKDISHITDKRIVILGCGAIGANLAVSLARRGFKNFFLFDYDRISEHNFSTQPWSKQDLGRLKATTLSSMIYSMTGAIGPTWLNKIERPHDIAGPVQTYRPDIFIDCFDNHDARQCVSNMGILWAEPYNQILHAGMSNQNTGEITWDIRYTVPPDVKLDDPCNYPMARTLVELTVVAASESILSFFLEGRKEDCLINANKLWIKKI